MSPTEQLIHIRKGTHGRFEDNSQITWDIMAVLQDSPNWKDAPTTTKVGTLMIVHKLARAFSGDLTYPDHWEDISGYSTLILKANKNQTA